MSKKNRDKKIQNRKQTSEVVNSFWKEKKPVMLFVSGFGLLMAVFYAFWFSEMFKINILTPVVKVNAGVASAVPRQLGKCGEIGARQGT